MDFPRSWYAVFEANFCVWWRVCKDKKIHVVWLGYVLFQHCTTLWKILPIPTWLYIKELRIKMRMNHYE